MVIKPGMYVRTTNGIRQISKINKNAKKWKYEYKLKRQDGDGTVSYGQLCDDDIIEEPSYDIKDILHIGDVIDWELKGRGYAGVNEVIMRPGSKKLGVYPEEWDALLPLKDIRIYTVLTYEQYIDNVFDVERGA